VITKLFILELQILHKMLVHASNVELNVLKIYPHLASFAKNPALRFLEILQSENAQEILAGFFPNK